MLIYLRSHVQTRVLQAFGFALSKNALLWLGTSESLSGDKQPFEPVNNKWRVYRSRGSSRPPKVTDMASPLRTPLARPVIGQVGPGLFLPQRRHQAGDDTAALHRALERGYLPPYLLVDEDLQLVLRHGPMDALLRVPEGMNSGDVRAMLPGDLGQLIAASWPRLEAAGGQDLVFRDFQTRGHNENASRLDIRMRRVFDEGQKRQLMAVYLDADSTAPGGKEISLQLLNADVEARIQGLEDALALSRSELQSTVEELESSNEELQSTNEELLASNEELQSLNEELQSVNEELHTVNAEYHAKLDETAETNRDLSLLLADLQVGVVFLDTALRIRRFNSRAANLARLMDEDKGRLITTLRLGTGDESLATLCQRAIDGEMTPEQRLRLATGKKIQVRASLSREDGNPVGVILSIMDVSDPVGGSTHPLAQALEATGQAIAIVQADGALAHATATFADLFERDLRWLEGTSAVRLFDPSAENLVRKCLLRALNNETVAVALRTNTEAGGTVQSKFVPLERVADQRPALLLSCERDATTAADETVSDENASGIVPKA